jgi:ribosome-binding factor A
MGFSMTKQERRSRDTLARDGGYRGQRLEGLFREELNSILESEISDPRLDGARVTRVDLTRDGSSARVWLALPRTEPAARPRAVEVFDRAAGFFRSRLCEALPLKKSPELTFKVDPLALASELEIDEPAHRS